MIFGNQLRSSKATVLLVGAILFIAIFVGLVYNHLDSFQVSSVSGIPPPVVDDSTVITPPEKQPETVPETHHESPPETVPESPSDDEPAQPTEPAKPADSSSPRPQTNDPSTIPDIPEQDALKFYFEEMNKPRTKVDAKMYKAWGAIEYPLKEGTEIRWKKPLGEKLCIIDLDNRPFNETGELFGSSTMSWDKPDQVHGLSLGILNHWAYAKIHGYKYYYVNINAYEDRRASWKKPPIMSQILKDHDACLYLDSDAIFYHLDLPFEWLMNYWGLHPSNNSLALAYDPASDNNKDEFGQVYLNTGFIVAQNNEKTYEIMDAWEKCPEEDGPHPDCVIFRTNGPGRPTDQGGFGTYTRYDYPDDIVSLSCNEANGFPESRSGCNGLFVRHLWTGKNTWIKATAGAQMPGPYLKMLHERYLEEKKDFYITEDDLMKGGRRA